MTAVAGIVMSIKLILSAIVGIRLSCLPAERRVTPERLLAFHFLVAGVLGSAIIIAAYVAWSRIGQLDAPRWVTGLHAFGQTANALGAAALFVFTQRIFHPDSAFARALSAACIGVLVLTVLGRAFHEGFAISIEPGRFHWIAAGARQLGVAWVAVESFRFWRRMRRRQQLGLAAPLVVNRFFVWGLWASGTLLSSSSEPLARTIYRTLAGDAAASTASIQGVAGPIITISLGITSLFAIVTTVALFLAFFPTRGYARWIESRAVAA